jgi:hypothetical protein
MSNMRLVVNVDAHFDWLTPAETELDKVMRAEADICAREAAHRLNAVFKLLISEWLAANKI